FTPAPLDNTLAVSVRGPGLVTGAGIECGLGLQGCEVDVTGEARVLLLAVPASGATFAGWGGACAGASSRTCVVTVDSPRLVTARFVRNVFAPPNSIAVVDSGRAVVRATSFGWTVTLRFHTRTGGAATVLMSRHGSAPSGL